MLRVELREVKEQRRADVVREVADDPQRGAERREVELERVGDVQRQLRGREIGGESRGEIAVDLDGVEMPGALDQRPRQRGETRTDLDQPVAGLRRDGVDDARDVVRIGEEILAKALPGLVAVHRREPMASAHSARSPMRQVLAFARARSRDPRRRSGFPDPQRAPSRGRRRGRAPCRGRPTCG